MRAAPDLPAETTEDRTVLRELRQLRGRATVGDVVARTGFPRTDAEASLKRLLETRRGNLEVGEAGDLVYRFDPRLVRRDAEPLWSRVRRRAWEAFKTGFKVWTLLMLVVYLVVFVALLLAALVAARSRQSGGGGGGGWGGGRGHHRGHVHFPSFWFWYLLWSPGWGWRRPYYGRRWEQRVGGAREAKVPLYKKVFAFVFGPDRPLPTRPQKDRSVIRLIRSRRGVITAADMVQHTGLRRHEAEQELARLVAAHEGDVKVAGAELVYVFPELMVSAHGRVSAEAPDPAWRRLEPPLEVTGNGRGTDVAIGLVNGFNLTAAATAPWVIFPQLGLGGAAAWALLVWVPLVFSALFFAIPLVRSRAVARENARREGRNLRKVLLSPVFRASLVGDGAQPLTLASALDHVRGALGASTADPRRLERELDALVADWDAEVSADAAGEPEYRFEAIRGEFLAAEQMRRALALESREVGEIVYSSADTPEQEARRDLEAFDRELARELPASGREAPLLSRYLPPSERVAYVDDFELVAFEDELRRGSALRR